MSGAAGSIAAGLMRRVTHIPPGDRAAAGVARHRWVHGRPAVLAARLAVAAARGRCLPTYRRRRTDRRRAGRTGAAGVTQRRSRDPRRPRGGIRCAGDRRGGESRARRRIARLVSHAPRPAGQSSAISSTDAAAPAAGRGDRAPDGGHGRRHRAGRGTHRFAGLAGLGATRGVATTNRAAASRCASCSRRPAGSRRRRVAAACCVVAPWQTWRRCRISPPHAACACC